MGKNLTQDEFLTRARSKHGNRYDYSKVEYVNSNENVIFICKIHGEFLQPPKRHLTCGGCLKCAILKKRLTTAEFIKRSIDKHGYEFDYSKVEYINDKNKVSIICKIHGCFKQKPGGHLRGKGCLKCANDFKRGTLSNFINSSIRVHGDKYDYSKVEYKSAVISVRIICKEHGEFLQPPNTHLCGSGCPKCCKHIKIMDTDEFIKRGKYRHGDKYDYSISNYITSKDKVEIICKTHGVFRQNAANHLFESGCPKCGTNYGKKENSWLDSLNVIDRQVRIDKYIVDGYDSVTNTIYEFNGDYWHGNPNKYDKDDINTISNKSFGELYQNTIEKENKLRELGYRVISIWESDYLKEKVLS